MTCEFFFFSFGFFFFSLGVCLLTCEFFFFSLGFFFSSLGVCSLAFKLPSSPGGFFCEAFRRRLFYRFFKLDGQLDVIDQTLPIRGGQHQFILDLESQLQPRAGPAFVNALNLAEDAPLAKPAFQTHFFGIVEVVFFHTMRFVKLMLLH